MIIYHTIVYVVQLLYLYIVLTLSKRGKDPLRICLLWVLWTKLSWSFDTNHAVRKKILPSAFSSKLKKEKNSQVSRIGNSSKHPSRLKGKPPPPFHSEQTDKDGPAGGRSDPCHRHRRWQREEDGPASHEDEGYKIGVDQQKAQGSGGSREHPYPKESSMLVSNIMQSFYTSVKGYLHLATKAIYIQEVFYNDQVILDQPK